MIEEDKVIVIDLDGTLCRMKKPEESYIDVSPNIAVVNKLQEYRVLGFYIIIYSSRNMKTYQGNIGKINVTTMKTMHEWLDTHKIPYDELHIGKPWAGRKGFYVDDRTIRPSEFLNMSYEEIMEITGRV